ncbi:Amino acid transporter [Handroanthus impetiginosus]|uniref:Amino acid transporter n=1 Tax=Handroanthus impetiginosus TaxID=429701 RepID=A0A2G9GEP6_9LAMI|nr:Amino acid transporter [Handroanthus impetiginosus]
MSETTGTRLHQHQVFDGSLSVPAQSGSNCYDDVDRLKRTGTVWTAGAHIITAVLGSESGVLSLAWATAQLGWIAGPIAMVLFACVTYATSTLLATCYRTGHPDTGERNYTYMDAVRANLGGIKVKLCGAIQYVDLFGLANGCTIAASISMKAIKRSNCFHSKGDNSPCRVSSNPYMIAFGVVEIIFSQIPDFAQIWWLSIVAAVMSSTYSTIAFGLGIAQVAETGKIKGSLTGISIGTVTETQKIWRSFQALGAIAFAYSHSPVLIEIQDTVKSPPSEYKTMKRATQLSVAVITIFHMLCGCFGYAAFGDLSPRNLLTGFSFYNPYWLLDIANAAVVIHLIGAYQVYCQPLFAFIEKTASEWFPNSNFIAREITIPIPGHKPYKLKLFRLVWRTIFVLITTIISMLMPFDSDVIKIFGALEFWPLAVYFPLEMYIVQKRIPKWSARWTTLQILSIACLVISIAALVGSSAGVVSDLKDYKPFKSQD